MRSLVFLSLLAACTASPPAERRQEPPLADAVTVPTREEGEAKSAASVFLQALKNRDAAGLRKYAVPAQAFRAYLPKNFDPKGKDESIAAAAAASEDPRLRRLAGGVVEGSYPGEGPGSVVVLVADPQGALHALEMGFEAGGYKVTRIGSDAFGDGGGRFVLDACTAFAAPFKIPREFSPKPSFDSCSARLRALEAGLAAKRPEARAELERLLEGQPLLERQRVLVTANARLQYADGLDGRAYQYGFEEGSALRRQFILGLNAYCSCLAPDAKK